MKINMPVLRIFITLLMISWAILFFPSVASIVFFICAILATPIKFLREKFAKRRVCRTASEDVLPAEGPQQESSGKALPSGPVLSLGEKENFDITIPSIKEGAPLAHQYKVKISLIAEESVIVKHHENKDWVFSPKEIGDKIHLFLGDDDIGILSSRSDMLKDWMRRDDPYIIVMDHYNSEKGCTASLFFYRDKRKGQEWREQTVVPLISYRSNDCQDVIAYLQEGEQVYLRDTGSGIGVFSHGDIIGKLPAKYARRVENEDIYAAFVETTEYDDGGSSGTPKEQPYIRIYWTTRASK